MSISVSKIWNRLFLEERPSIGLSFFRIFAALTVGLHVLPSFFHLDDNYLSTAFKDYNLHFFTPQVMELVQRSPDAVVMAFVGIFGLSCFFFLIGFFAQISCIVMTLACYYFYALNCFHIGTLSWDILLVTLFLMCLTNVHGDYFSVDCLRRGNVDAYKTERPFFIQRLLQMQIASTYFYTALYKITASGNWFTGNPLYYLWNYPPEGVTKQFLFREFFAARPELCHVLAVAIVAAELALGFLLFIPRTRMAAIIAGFIFHILLVLTLHVPTIFFFLFPPQLLLFIHPALLVQWIEKKRHHNEIRGQAQIIYDGHCQFCIAGVKTLLTMDLFGVLKKVDYHGIEIVSTLHPSLTKELCHSQLHLIEKDGRLTGGFLIFRRLCWKIPMLFPLMPLFYFPGSSLLGPVVYRWIAKNRYLFHVSRTCKDNKCFMA